MTAGPITRRIVAVGTLQAVKPSKSALKCPGSCNRSQADYNSPVHAGQVIARIDPAAYDAQAREARAALAQAQATSARAHADVRRFEVAVEDARTRLTRAVALVEDADHPAVGAGRRGHRSRCRDGRRSAAGEAAADQAEAAVQQAAAAVEKAAIDVEHTIIRSPIDGIAIERNVSVGQTLAASIQAPVLFRISADLKRRCSSRSTSTNRTSPG